MEDSVSTSVGRREAVGPISYCQWSRTEISKLRVLRAREVLGENLKLEAVIQGLWHITLSTMDTLPLL